LPHAATTLTATYNDLEGVREIFKEHKGEIAGVILEPVVGNSGFIVPTQEFLQVSSLPSYARVPRALFQLCWCFHPVDIDLPLCQLMWHLWLG